MKPPAPLPNPDPRTLGARLRAAREARGWTQQQVAKELGMARTTLVAIEKGERRVRPGELVQFAKLYGQAASSLLQRGAPVEAFGVQLRAAISRLGPVDAELLAAIEDFQGLCEDYARLEEVSGVPRRRRDPPTYDIDRADPLLAAEDVASAERRRLGLGDGPLLNLREVLELDLGLRVFQPNLPAPTAGMFAFTDELGGCIAINLRHPAERRRLTLAHELGHFLTDRFRSEVLPNQSSERRLKGERFAEGFARAFLMPQESLRRRFLELQRSRGGEQLTGDLPRLAQFYAVSTETMAHRLEELRLIPPGEWERAQGGGLRVLRTQTIAEDNDLFPSRYVALAVEAWQKGELSEGQLAHFLRTDRLGARERVQLLEGASSDDPDAMLDLAPRRMAVGA